MKWLMKDPKPGDILRVESGIFMHFGIYVSDEEIIQFGMPPTSLEDLQGKDIRICVSDIDAFCRGAFVEVASLSFQEKKKARKPADVIAYARSKIGMGGYDILENNCEHFVNDCVFGKKFSEQVDKVKRNTFRRIPYIDLYISEIPASLPPCPLFPPERQAELDACGNENVRRQKQYAWQVLGFALKKTCSIDMRESDIHKTESGKWICSDACFSLSHSPNFVAVAVAKMPVGVDIEELPDLRMEERLYERIATEAELSSLGAAPSREDVARLWTLKESVFKRIGTGHFSPCSINTLTESARCFRDNAFDGLMIAVSAESLECINVYHLSPETEACADFTLTPASVTTA